MKFRHIKFTRHPILGNLELDFRHADGSVYNNIVFAGENGAGKTVLLEYLYGFSTSLHRLSTDGAVEIEFEVTDSEILEINDVQTKSGNRAPLPTALINHVMVFKFNQSTETGVRGQVVFKDDDGNERKLDAVFFAPVFKAMFSDVAINFNAKAISNVTAKDLDASLSNKCRSGSNLADEIKQLLIDINAADAEELQQWIDVHPDTIPPTDIQHRRIKRFTQAFDQMFDAKKFKGVENVNGHKDVLFTENGHEMSIDRLCSGEKQIVFRGSFLLKDINNLNGHVLLIDEPELSMHPKWERKILGFFKTLFTDNTGQKVQMFFATHSEHIVKEALGHMADNLVVVLSKDTNGVTAKNITAPDKLRVVTSAEANYLAFGLYSSDYHIQLYGALQVKENKSSILDCDRFITTTTQYNHDSANYTKNWVYNNTTYTTLPTFIRNTIDHPDNTQNYSYSEEELEKSTELLRDLI